MNSCKERREGQTVVPRERPCQSGDRCEDVKERDEDDDGQHDNEEIGRRLRASCLIVDLDDWKSVGRYHVNVADGEENRDHVCELHDSIQHDGGNHGARNTDARLFDFVGHVQDTIETFMIAQRSESQQYIGNTHQ